MSKIWFLFFFLFLHIYVAGQKPNVIIIYADDLGYGDLSCYGAVKIKTPQLDQLAKNGLRFTNGHSTSATCTPSRFALITGNYPWRRSGTEVLPGDASLIVPTDKTSLPKIFRQAGYTTGLVGKWHLGLGNDVQKNWNAELKPGPLEVGFDHSFIFPATADRVPTVFIENHNVVGAELNDPIQVDYKKKIGSEPTGKEHPELLKLKATPNHGHDNTIVNGIGRIGYMTGGTKARWTDEEMPLSFMEKSLEFIRQNQHHPFFLFYALTEPHVPRMPSTMFKGKSRLGFRGDAILQIDWTVGKIMESLKSLGLEKNTIIIFTSDNGPVLDDGYLDGAVTELNSHTPWGQLRGGKYSLLEAATRVPFIISWPLKIKPGVSDAMVCQMDFIASFSKLLDVKITPNEQLDSENTLNAFLGTSKSGRKILVEQSIKNFAIIQNEWKFIPPNNGPSNTGPLLTNIETGNSILPQLYHLKKDPGESTNLATEFPNKVKELDLLLNKTIQKNYQHR